MRLSRFAVLCGFIVSSFTLSAAPKTWTGISSAWSNAASWSPGGAPVNGDFLVFPQVTGITSSVNDLPAGLVLSGISITSSSSVYNFLGNGITLTGGIDSTTSAVTHTFGISVTFSTAASIDFSGSMSNVDAGPNSLSLRPASAGLLVMNAAVSSTGNVTTLTRPGQRVVFTTTNNIASPGQLVVQGATEVNGTGINVTSVQADRLSGNGFPANGVLTVAAGGTIAPGPGTGTGIGQLDAGTLALNGAYEADVLPAAATPADKINASANVSIGSGALLNILPAGTFSFLPNQVLTLINNTGPNPVTGAFGSVANAGTIVISGGVPNNATFVINGNTFRINYDGGTGNDVTLTSVVPARRWTGGGVSNNWSDGGNWAEGSPACNGCRLVFPSGPANKTTNNDLSALTLDSLDFQTSGYTITSSGLPFAVTNGINAPAGANIGVQITAAAPQTWSYQGTMSNGFDIGANNLTFNTTGSFSTAGTTIFGTTGVLTVSGGGGFFQAATVQPAVSMTGNVILGNQPGGYIFQRDVTDNSSSTCMCGTGSIGGNLTMNLGGLSPGNSPGTAAIITLGGTAPGGPRLNIQSNFQVDINGASVGQYDRIDVTGTVVLGASSTLNPVTMGYPATPGTEFVIINNDGADAVSGQFSGKPQNSVVVASGQPLRIRYDGGDGNDVSLTRLSNPTITSIVPNTGATAGGYLVTISGTEFQPSPIVMFGGNVATVTGASATSITVMVPAHASGPVNVVVTNTTDGGQASVVNGFTYNAPVITSITPTSGGIGTAVTINGTNMGFVNAITFNGVSATVGTTTATSVQTVVPAGVAPGTASVVVSSNASTSNAFPFTRLSSPSISSVTPANGPTGGGTAVTIAGNDFMPGVTVKIGGISATVTGSTPTTINITTPPFIPGPKGLVITNPDGFTASSTFTYNNPSITTLTPSAGFVGASVQIDGDSLNATTNVTFGGVAASFTVVNPTRVIATVPSIPPGPASVVVTAVTSTSNSLTFTRVSQPTISPIAPAPSGPTIGGTSVTMNGTDFMSGATVTVAGSPATVTSVSPTSITFTTPLGASGPASIVLTNPDGQSTFSPTPFTYDSPSIASISPTSGGIGTVVTLNGASLNSVDAATVNGINTTFTLMTGTQMQLTVPAGVPPGPAMIVVSSGTNASNGFAFTRLSAPTITDVAPPNGPTSGGITVTVSGTEFLSGATVTVGGNLASVTTVTSTSIAFTLPAGTSGPKPLVITNPDGQTVSSSFTYDAPSISSITPTSGFVGDTVTINGTSLNTATVTFNGVPATIVSSSATQLQVTVPSIPPGQASVVATSGASTSNSVTFTRTSVPTITSISPSNGSTAGGITVVISGSEFMPGATVTIGGTPAAVTSASATSISVNLPTGTSGPKPVVVSNPDGQTATGTFTYDAPSITNVSPSAGQAGTVVTVTGTSFTGVNAVTVGGVPVPFTLNSPTQLQITIPSGAPGSAPIVVSSNAVTSNAAPFTRISSPVISSLSPSSGPTSGGIVVTINGSDFVSGATVTVAGNAVAATVNSSSNVTFTLPSGSSGPVPVVLTNPDGQTATATFTYNSPSITAISPTSGAPGTVVTVNGTSMNAVTSVTVGGVSAAFTIVNATQIQVTIPPLPAGNAALVISSGSFSSSPATFAVVCPALTVAISGPTAACAGDTVTLIANPSSTPVTYLWSTGATTQSITVTAGAAPSYTVTVTNPTGCTATATHTINAPARGLLSIDAPSSVVAGGTATATVVRPPTGATTFTWAILNGEIVSGQGTPSITFRAGASGAVSLSVSAPLAACSASGVATVTIQNCATSPATLTAPAVGASVNSPVTFSWTAVSNAASYEVWAGATAATAVLIGTTNDTTFTTALTSGGVEWFVVTRLATACSPNALQSATRSFSVAQVSNCPQAAPVAVSPTDASSVFSPIVFRWTGVEGATGYNVFVRSASGGTQDLGVVQPNITSVTAMLPPGDYTWFVAAIYSGCPPVSSTGVRFFVDPEDCSKHDAPSLVAPSNGITVPAGTVNFQWTAVEGADGYRVWTFNMTRGEQAAALGETNDTKFSATLEPGTIGWFIEALFKGCPSTNSPTQTFIVPAAINCSNNVAPSLFSPGDSQTLSEATVTFAWSSVGAVEYELFLSVNSGTPALLTKTAATSFTTQVPQGDLEFFVRALFSGCPALTSASRRFRYQPPAICSTERPILIAPQNESVPIPSPVKFRWSRVNGATSYRLAILATDGAQVINTTETEATVSVASGTASWSVTAIFPGSCPRTDSATSQFVVVATPSGCIELTQPIIAAPSQITQSIAYFVQWQPVVGATSYVLQRSTTGLFDNTGGTMINDTQASFTDVNSGTDPIIIYYRVRPVSSRCTPVASGPFSAIVGVVILPNVQSSTTSEGSTLAAQSQTITYSIQLGAELAGSTFSATPTAPWITVKPSSGVIPATGIQLVVTAEPDGLPVGTSAGNVIVGIVTPDAPGSGLKRSAHAASTLTVPVNVNKVTPVGPNPKSTPPPDALIIPAVAHADGINSKFQSDVRITNTSAQVIKYQLTFTPTGEQGIADGRQATVDIEPGRTMALDDVLKTWFGTGTTSALGTLEIRPLTKTASSTSSAAVRGLQNFSTFASSRTFNLTSGGTFGQYIPAIPFANFVGRSADAARPLILSMQQIAQSDAFRTNLGFLEGSGEPASLLVSVFGDKGLKLTEFTVNLNGGQHLQMGSVLAQRGVQVNDGRIEVRVTSPGGKVSAYASVLDNKTNDSLLVTPIAIGDAGNTKFVLPGVAELSGGIPWRTDMRLFNASDDPVTATLTFQPLNSTTAQTAEVQILPREVRQFDRVLNSLFGVTNDGGALHITTARATNLVATARTYRPDVSGGSFGQFISAVTPNEAVSLGTRPLQILQVEESPRFRSNIGIAEVTGRTATVEVTVLPPDSKASAVLRIAMGPNQVRQLNSLLAQLGLTDTHNARVTVRVVEGQGRVTAYASVIDAQTADPTYVPAQ